jgi:hypothetical protein
MNLKDLSDPFPREAIHWRAQTITRNGDKALALAYLDARDVMDRLDEVCGPENWQSRYVETAKGRVLCEIGIRVGDEWVWKSDGAGDTAVEGEKGGISDALKRAAVQWGIGRYLYRLDAVWAPCETYERNGKAHWKAWRGSPWDSVRNAPPQSPRQDQQDRRDEQPAFNPRAAADRLIGAIRKRKGNREELQALWEAEKPTLANLPDDMFAEVKGEFTAAAQAQANPPSDDLGSDTIPF